MIGLGNPEWKEASIYDDDPEDDDLPLEDCVKEGYEDYDELDD